MKPLLRLLVVALLTVSAYAEQIPITILHLNDIHEILPSSNGKEGGIARVATVRRDLKRRNPRTITVLAGDFLSPSVMGTAVVDGQPLAGRHAVALMNEIGFDVVSLGNHEFDVNEQQFQTRIREARFRLVSSNVKDANGKPFERISESVIQTVKGDNGGVVRIGFVSGTLPANQKAWVRYDDPVLAVREQARRLRPQVDILIALTHEALESDISVAESAPEIDLIFGGHEHENILIRRGPNFTPIMKADANTRSVYIVELVYDTVKRTLTYQPRFQRITAAIADDPPVAASLNRWARAANAGFRARGFEPDDVVATVSQPLDGREGTVRTRSGPLTDLILNAMMKEAPQADVAVLNGGSIRIDDVIPAGPLRQYDVLRILPFGGKIVLAELRGDVLERAVDQGRASRWKGSYLHVAKMPNPIQPERYYRVALPEFLMTGMEQGMSYLKPGEPGIGRIEPLRDIRLVLIDYFRATQPEKKAAMAGH